MNTTTATATDARHWRAPQVCALTGATYRQLDYWARTGVLRPSIREAHGSGTQRRYSTADILRVLIARRLSEHGMRGTDINVLRSLPDLETEGRWIVVTNEGPFSDAAIVDTAQLVHAVAGSVAVVVDLDDLRTELDERIRDQEAE